MNKSKKDLSKIVNDPFQGKGEFMPEKIQYELNARMGLNENIVFPLDNLKNLLHEIINEIDPRIYPEDYSNSLCALLAKENNLNENQVVVGNGGDKIIDLMVRLTLYKGSNGIVINPTYSMYEHAIKIQGGGFKQLLLTKEPNYDLDVDYVLSNINQREDKLLFLCSPNNPTGNQFSKQKIQKIINEFQGIVALDETYVDFGGYSFISELRDFPNLIIMKSMAKFYGLAGMRLGFAFADEFLISRIKELLPAFNVNIVTMELAKKIIEQKEVLKSVKQIIINERSRLFDEMLKIEGIRPYPSITNFILFKLKNQKAKDIHYKLMKEKGILVRNMSSVPLCKNCLRVSIATPSMNERFLTSLNELLEKTQ